MTATTQKVGKLFAALVLAFFALAANRPALAQESVPRDAVRPVSARSAPEKRNTAPISTARPISPEWFENELADAGLRELAAERFAKHRRLIRSDMLAIFALATEAKEIDADQMQTLRTIVQNAKSLNIPPYVADLARKVVFGDPANAHFQGQALGNLEVGSPAAQLDALVRKWFLGEDLPALDSKYHYQKAAGMLFNGEPKVSDLHQGDLGDCYFVAPLGEVAMRNPNQIRQMFIDNLDGTFSIRFYHNGKPFYVTVNRELPADKNGRFVYDNRGDFINNPKNILWVALAEKALAQLNESGWLKTLGKAGENSYAAIGAGGKSSLALPLVCGISTARDGVESISGFDKGELQIANSKKDVPSFLVPTHSYVVVGYDAAKGEVTLFNPWGLHGNKKDIKFGQFTMSWEDFWKDFQNIDHAKLGPKPLPGPAVKAVAKNTPPKGTPAQSVALVTTR